VPRHPGTALFAKLAGPAKALMTRGMLLGIQRRAEGRVQAEAAATGGGQLKTDALRRP
jgi:hypothetical protein